MKFTAAQISILLNGKIEGNADVTVSSFGKIEEAQEGQLSFLANPKYEDYLYTTRASLIIINENYELREPVKPTLIRVTHAYTAFVQLLSKYQEMVTQQMKGIQQPSYIASSAKLDEDVFIGAFSYVGENVRMGRNTRDTENLTNSQYNFLKAVASGIHKGLSSKEVVHEYRMGTSANVLKIKKALIEKELIDEQPGNIQFLDPVYELWFRKNILRREIEIG